MRHHTPTNLLGCVRVVQLQIQASEKRELEENGDTTALEADLEELEDPTNVSVHNVNPASVAQTTQRSASAAAGEEEEL
jgi:hypothetical protein